MKLLFKMFLVMQMGFRYIFALLMITHKYTIVIIWQAPWKGRCRSFIFSRWSFRRHAPINNKHKHCNQRQGKHFLSCILFALQDRTTCGLYASWQITGLEHQIVIAARLHQHFVSCMPASWNHLYRSGVKVPRALLVCKIRKINHTCKLSEYCSNSWGQVIFHKSFPAW
jgi:hypothetical protein